MRVGPVTTGRARQARAAHAPASGPTEPAKQPIRWSSAWSEARALVWSRRWRLALGLVLMLVNRLSGEGRNPAHPRLEGPAQVTRIIVLARLTNGHTASVTAAPEGRLWVAGHPA